MRALRIAIVFATLFVVSRASAKGGDPDPWFAKDKAAHAGISGGIAAASYGAGALLFESRGHALIAAGVFTLAVGAAKEVADLAGFGTPSWKDFAWDGIGTAFGLALAWSVDLVVRGVSPAHPLLKRPVPVAQGIGFAF